VDRCCGPTLQLDLAGEDCTATPALELADIGRFG